MHTIYTQLSIEHETTIFKFNQLNKDFLDNLIKMKIAVKTRQQAEKFNNQMRQRLNELESTINEANLLNSESRVENEVQRRKIKEQD